MSFGEGKFTYEYAPDWAGLTDGYHEGWIPGVAVDSKDRVFIYSRSEKPLNVYDTDGNHLARWGEGVIQPNAAHGIFIDGDDHVFVTDAKDHAVYKFNPAGELLMTLGTPGRPGEGEGAPFNRPTDIAVASTACAVTIAHQGETSFPELAQRQFAPSRGSALNSWDFKRRLPQWHSDFRSCGTRHSWDA